ncbi:hypothetical protein B0T24DRAFT_621821 [Lasiosphaeria ovina]|uniref:NACHT domain-containing protein n=1 Tax=Lasiosphaeria ovina TaxID=92902 RepID=A0AAE0N845_9PEZI|nr:hypothetical protein B0T24DRAFT_621821 [Lasiosphaeria ovina]
MHLQERLEAFTRDSEDRTTRIKRNFANILESLDRKNAWQTELVKSARQNLYASTFGGGSSQDSNISNSAAAANQLDVFSSFLSASAKQDREDFIKRRTLETLNFPDLRDRYERISEAHQKTFDWVFHETNAQTRSMGEGWDNFANWLMSNKPLYWITGKPGPGKSTLMKYLSDDMHLQQYLKVWRSDKPVCISRFFFWNSGTTMQMSRIGLLQSLLYQNIGSFPDEIPRLFPDRWRYQGFFGYDARPWSWSQLSQAFQALVSDQNKMFFFLIDGLDEFDGDCQELAQFLLGVASTGSNVKFCVASRPWLVFEDAFQRRPSLRMEDLTLKDIRLFASEKLTGNIMFAQLRDHNHESADMLIEEVTQKSSGVFLWVPLVVKSLLEGLRDGDTVGDLQARLLLLPRDLESLFQKILGVLDAEYFEQGAKIFQTVRASHVPWRDISLENAKLMESEDNETAKQSRDNKSPLALLSLSFSSEDPQWAFSAKYGEPMSSSERNYRAETMRRRLNSRCKGLLEAPTFGSHGPEAKVQYLHRTVKDFLEEDRARTFLAAGSGAFDPHVALCAALLRHTKAISPSQDDEEASGMMAFSGLLQQFIVQCHWLEKQGRGDYVPFLDEMDRTTELILGYPDITEVPGTEMTLPHWTKRVDPYVGKTLRVDSVFDYAVVRSLTHYIRWKLDSGYSFTKNRHREYLLDCLRTSGNQTLLDLLDSTETSDSHGSGSSNPRSNLTPAILPQTQEIAPLGRPPYGGGAPLLGVPPRNVIPLGVQQQPAAKVTKKDHTFGIRTAVRGITDKFRLGRG